MNRISYRLALNDGGRKSTYGVTLVVGRQRDALVALGDGHDRVRGRLDQPALVVVVGADVERERRAAVRRVARGHAERGAGERDLVHVARAAGELEEREVSRAGFGEDLSGVLSLSGHQCV